MEREYKFKGYTFTSQSDYENAKKEHEMIEYIKARTDMESVDKMASLYNRMVDRKMINTVIGLDFLKELREAVLKTGVVTDDKLRPIPTLEKKQIIIKKKPLTRVQRLERQNIGLKLVIFGLIVIIIGMFIIVLTGKSSPLKGRYEEEILNKYAGWKQELDSQQQKINDALYYLEQNGITIDLSQSEKTPASIGGE